MRKLIVMLMIIMIFMISTVASAFLQTSDDPYFRSFSNAFSDVDVGWYEVQDWELAICSTYGPQSNDDLGGVITDPSLQDNPGYLTTVAATVSGKKTLLPDGVTYLYEFSWYIQPIVDTIDYSIYLKESEDEQGYLLTSDQGAPPYGSSGYYTDTLLTNYSYISIETFGSGRYAGFTMRAPVIEVPLEE